MKQKLILLTLVIGLTIVSQSTLSLGMGNIQVYSSLDEPLRSTIELNTNPEEELLNLQVKLASSDDYKKVGLDKSFVPSNIIVSLDEENPNLINVTSNGPVSEPIVSLLLDVNWNNGRILREFTILLDPPIYDASSDVQINNMVVDSIDEQMVEEEMDNETQTPAGLVSRTEENATYSNEDVAQYDNTKTTTPVNEMTDSEVYVNEGDTLWSIASQNKVGELSTNQMMMAIYNNNASAFIDNNINKLIKGSRLDMPSLSQAQAISYAEALAQVESHNQLWAPSQEAYSTYQTAEDEYSDYEDTSSSLDYGVQLSGGDSDGSDNGQSNAELGDGDSAELSAEEQFNQESESSELKERISELEEIVEQQQTVLEIKDDSLSNLETQLGEATVAETSEGVTESIEDVVDDVWDTGEQVAEEVDTTLDEALDLQIANVTEGQSETGMDGADTASSETANVDEADKEEVAQTTPKAPVKFNTPVQKTESMVDKTVNWVMDNLKWVLIGLVGLIVLLFVPKMLRGKNNDDEGVSFLDDIKQRNKSSEESNIDTDLTDDTKMNAPLDTDDESALVESEVDEFEVSSEDSAQDNDDVLAELDKSIMFDETDEDDEMTDFLSDESDESASDNQAEDDKDEFDLDSFLSDVDEVASDEAQPIEEVAEQDESTQFNLDELDDDGLDDLAKVADDNDLDIDLDSEDEADDFDLSDLDDLELDEPGEVEEDITEEVVPEVKSVTESDDDEFNFDDDFDFDLDDELEEDLTEKADEVTEAVSGEIEAVVSESEDDFDDILDLSDDDGETFNLDEDDETMDEEIDLGLDGLLDEGDAIDTKLDLAKAYLDMGDAEGAKNLLDEVVAEGSESQAAEAKKIIDDM